MISKKLAPLLEMLKTGKYPLVLAAATGNEGSNFEKTSRRAWAELGKKKHNLFQGAVQEMSADVEAKARELILEAEASLGEGKRQVPLKIASVRYDEIDGPIDPHIEMAVTGNIQHAFLLDGPTHTIELFDKCYHSIEACQVPESSFYTIRPEGAKYAHGVQQSGKRRFLIVGSVDPSIARPEETLFKMAQYHYVAVGDGIEYTGPPKWLEETTTGEYALVHANHACKKKLTDPTQSSALIFVEWTCNNKQAIRCDCFTETLEPEDTQCVADLDAKRATYATVGTEVKPSLINHADAGQGLFLTQDAADGAVVACMAGTKRVKWNTWEKHRDTHNLPPDACIHVKSHHLFPNADVVYDTEFTNPSKPSKWYRPNHSCNPTCKLQAIRGDKKDGAQMVWVTKGRQTAGTEMTFTYDKQSWCPGSQDGLDCKSCVTEPLSRLRSGPSVS